MSLVPQLLVYGVGLRLLRLNFAEPHDARTAAAVVTISAHNRLLYVRLSPLKLVDL